MTHLTPFEVDIREQPAALRRLAEAPVPDGLAAVFNRDWDRIIFTGMGSSHFAGMRTWQKAIAAGRRAWGIDSSQLIDMPGLVTKDSLLVITSQSGASGEVVELLRRTTGAHLRRPVIVGICDDHNSPLANASDFFIALHSGDEATVSTKSYLNSLAIHRQIISAITKESLDASTQQILATAHAIESQIESIDTGPVAADALTVPSPRVIMIGKGTDAATALYAGLIVKEAAKIPAEGFIGGQFRHGPMELAGPGLTAILFGAHTTTGDPTIRRLATDLIATGSKVVLAGDEHIENALTIPTKASFPLEGLATGAVLAQYLAVEFAHANGVIPGRFLFGQKITTVL